MNLISERLNRRQSYRRFKYLVFSDLYRLEGRASLGLLLQAILTGESFKYIFWMRLCRYARSHPLLRYAVFPFARAILNHYKYKFGISIPIEVDIDSGLYIGHFSGIFVYPLCVIGKNCSLSQGVTLGKTNRGKSQGYPTIGDNVYIGPGAKIIGAVHVGSGSAIGANCVVTKDVPENAVVVGVPGRVISCDGSQGYVTHTDYEEKAFS